MMHASNAVPQALLSEKIGAPELATVLPRYYSTTKILSLDCFDTLLWRMTATPIDVFFKAQHTSAFQAIGLTAALRQQAETKARQKRSLQQGHMEVTLQDIYREYLPTLTDEQVDALIQAEIATELTMCYGFPPILEAIRDAHRHHLSIIIVSDTYFTEKQLRRMLAALLPDDVMLAISKIFCSSQYHKSKTNGLFQVVLRELTEKPENFLHIGDHYAADYQSARSLNMAALHFIQSHDYLKNLQRLHGIAANLMSPSVRTTQPLFDPFRALFSSTPYSDRPEFLIGYYSLGPIMYHFAQFIVQEIEKLRQAGCQPKVLFLMRDGHLPALACEALTGQSIGHPIRLSRFVAFAASFQTIEDIDAYLLDLLQSKRFADISRQLLLPEKVSEPLIKTAENSPDPQKEFARLVRQNHILRIIFKKSADYRMRLKRYLEKEIGITAGDTLIFVDLGYTGTAQRQLSKFFQAMNVTLEGRYLLALSTSIKETHRVGLLDATHYDNKTLSALVNYIALFEQLCTANEKSCIDYDEAGNVIYSAVGISAQQHTKLCAIQAECIRFILDAKKFFTTIPHKISTDISRAQVLAELARLIFLSTAPELQYLLSFQFDLNLGTHDIYQLFDPKQGLAGLKRRGLFYIDKNSPIKRTNYPTELRFAGFELALTFMSLNRFNLDANLEDILTRKEFIETRITHQQNTFSAVIEAAATHDGYFALWLAADSDISFHIGKRYQWLQIESIQLIKKEAFAKQEEAGNSMDVESQLILHDVADHGHGLLQCLSKSSMIAMQLNNTVSAKGYVLRIVYRPIVFC